uniref:FZ domain-containing protein n=1 Tax=Ciona intestinalis TaxID=7719 RepID=F6WD67_CIOIN
MFCLKLLFCSILIFSLQKYSFAKTGKCRKVTSGLCKDIISYKFSLPTLLKHTKRRSANKAIRMFDPFIKMNCSPYLRPFLCTVFFAPCNRKGAKLPCRSLCEGAKSGCANIMERLGFVVPEALSCDKFPKQTSTSHCIQPESFDLLPMKKQQ